MRSRIILTLIVFAWLLPQTVQAAEITTLSEDPGLDFSLADFKDKTHTLANYRGKVLLVNFWASWCPPCIYEMPELTRLQQQLGDRPFEIIAINVGEKKYKVHKFTRLINFELPVLLDTSNQAFKDWRVQTLPTSFLVDANGVVRHKIRGNPGWEQQETIALIEQLIAESSAPAILNN
ncbi:MAG: TlpA family protein disulfide reductase [Gammaproteobacteria bacterium]|nr:TlpA family protein disulfide reductase [Gammaproteobacteria bacterium]